MANQIEQTAKYDGMTVHCQTHCAHVYQTSVHVLNGLVVLLHILVTYFMHRKVYHMHVRTCIYLYLS